MLHRLTFRGVGRSQMAPRTARRLLLVAGVLAAVALLLMYGCGVTEWQRDQDARSAAIRDLHSPEMEKRLAEARDGR